MKYTAEEVRAQFEAWLIREHEYAPEDLIWQEKRNCYADYATHLAWNAYRDAYADLLERIKADESAAPVGFVMEATATRHKFGLLTQDLPPGAELFTHPPAQAAQTDDWRIGFFERWREAAREKGYVGIAEAITAAPTATLRVTTPAPPINLAAVREVIASHINEAKNLRHDPELQDYLYAQADKLEAAIKGVE